MKDFKKSQHGFTSLEVILLVLVVGIVVGAGVYVYSNRSKSSDQPTPSQTTSIPAPTETDEQAIITEKLTKIYATYSSAGANSSQDLGIVATATQLADQGLISQRFVAQIRQDDQNGMLMLDPVTCSQIPANSYTFSDIAVTGDSATAKVAGSFEGQEKVFTVQLKKENNQWLLDNTVCTG